MNTNKVEHEENAKRGQNTEGNLSGVKQGSQPPPSPIGVQIHLAWPQLLGVWTSNTWRQTPMPGVHLVKPLWGGRKVLKVRWLRDYCAGVHKASRTKPRSQCCKNYILTWEHSNAIEFSMLEIVLSCIWLSTDARSWSLESKR